MGRIGWIFQENCYLCCRKINKPKVMTRETTRRRISAWVLLAIFVPILIVSSLHIHQSGTTVDDSSIECVHNHCGGHLNQQTVSLHDCVLCQFLTLPLLLASVISLFLLGDKRRKVKADVWQGNVCVAHLGIVGLRSPPALSCSPKGE